MKKMNRVPKVIDMDAINQTYSINEDGSVFNRATGTRLGEGKAGNGYRKVSLKSYGGIYLHRLVASRFLPNPLNLPQVNHKNGIKADNRVENLEWVTAKQNLQHAIDTRLRLAVGEENPASKLTEGIVEEIRDRYFGDGRTTQDSLAAEYGIHRVNVKNIVTGRIWKHTWDTEKYPHKPRWKNNMGFGCVMKHSAELILEVCTKYATGKYGYSSLSREMKLPRKVVTAMVKGEMPDVSKFNLTTV